MRHKGCMPGGAPVAAERAADDPVAAGELCELCRSALADPFWEAIYPPVSVVRQLFPTGGRAMIGTQLVPIQSADFSFDGTQLASRLQAKPKAYRLQVSMAGGSLFPGSGAGSGSRVTLCISVCFEVAMVVVRKNAPSKHGASAGCGGRVAHHRGAYALHCILYPCLVCQIRHGANSTRPEKAWG